MNIRNWFGLSGRGRRTTSGFSLVEILVASGVVCIAIISVIAIVRKGQEQMSVEKHRRTARAIVDTILEAPRFSPEKYPSISTTTTIPGSFTLDNNVLATASFVIENKQYIDANSDFPYKRIWVKLQWTEPGNGAVDSVAIERWIPNIPKPNIAPMASSVSSPDPFKDCNHYSLVANCLTSDCNCQCWKGGWGIVSSPEIYYANPWCAVDGIIGARINGDWADNNNGNPIDIKWSTSHKILKIVLYNRNNNAVGPGDCWATGATITLYKNTYQVGSVTSNTGFSNGTVVPIFLSPTDADEIKVWPLGGHAWPGMSEIEVYE